MTETKAESQNYLANPYSYEYVLSVLRFSTISFRLFACHLSNGRERGVIRQKPLHSLRPPDTIHQVPLPLTHALDRH
jgi:hypothetical protein